MNRSFVIASLALALSASPLFAQQEMPPKQVGVVEMQLQEVPRIVTLPGRAIAGEEAAIRPRVSGLVKEILYKAGTPLTAGDPMFRIDATTYEAAVVSAEAEVISANAAVTQANSAYERVQRLSGSAATAVDVENALLTKQQADARLKSAQAALALAQAELGWTTITSPIAGLAGVAQVSVGDLVTASQGDALAVVTRLDPIDVDMYEPSARLLGLFDDINSGKLKMNDTITATLTLETGQTYSAKGELLAPGHTVSTTTGAVDHRFRFENAERRLLPGMFVRGQVEMGRTEAFLVSQSAATRDRTGKLSVFVVQDGKAVRKELVDDGTYQNNWIVVEGLTAGDLLVADGLMGLMDGAAVTTVPVDYDAQGVVRNVTAPEGAETAPEEAATEDAPAASE
jgi:membrane fusion protein (multidrug efflux system)